MVLGAGRGPLVNASLRAAKQADRKLRVYAVEKNPNAVVTCVRPVRRHTFHSKRLEGVPKYSSFLLVFSVFSAGWRTGSSRSGEIR